MSRRPVFFVLMMSMLLQAVSLGGHWVGRGSPTETLHDVLHWSGISHHHAHGASLQADGLLAFESLSEGLGLAAASSDQDPHQAPHPDFHQDQSADSNHHMALDACLSAMGPIPAGVDSPTIRAACSRPDARPEAPPADPELSGPRRPPRPFA
ncbi:hypothetical protein [Roseateles microcysteis]|uniref:hypothetical protein n=1 Tax=Roseateles microcysteis TaxID=3119057 RepID=UPI002FE53D2B